MANRILALDIGNTRTKAAVFERNQLVRRAAWITDEADTILNWITNHLPATIIFCSTAMVPEYLTEIASAERVLELDHQTNLPFANRYHTPETLGRDRLAAVIGAFARYGDQHFVVIDAGTCITFDFHLAERGYQGGNIAPGIQMRLRAMHEFTARLPLPERRMEAHFVGRRTDAALRNGAQWGAIWEVQSFVETCIREYGSVRTILTGGDGPFLRDHLNLSVELEPDLVLYGLHYLAT